MAQNNNNNKLSLKVSTQEQQNDDDDDLTRRGNQVQVHDEELHELNETTTSKKIINNLTSQNNNYQSKLNGPSDEARRRNQNNNNKILKSTSSKMVSPTRIIKEKQQDSSKAKDNNNKQASVDCSDSDFIEETTFDEQEMTETTTGEQRGELGTDASSFSSTRAGLDDEELLGAAEDDILLGQFKKENNNQEKTPRRRKSVSRSVSTSGDFVAFVPPPHLQVSSDMKRAVSQTMLEFDAKMQSSENKCFQIEWKNLNYSYRLGLVDSLINMAGSMQDTQSKSIEPSTGNTIYGRHQILKNLSGSICSNQLVAIVGPSGCGKTTLLQLLSGSMPIQGGQLSVSGMDEPRVSFIGQHDPLLPDLTAKETLVYASRLQNTRPNFNHSQHVEPVIQALGLSECAHRSVQRLSGGQMKRVCIAQELLYPTNLLILDEITSGLDASTSYSIIKQLKKLTSDQSYPMSIVISIHQPSARLFSVFDKVYVMSSGRCLYEGSCQIEPINAHLRLFNLECPKFNNIADFLIEIASDDMHAKAAVREKLFSYHDKTNNYNDSSDEDKLIAVEYNKNSTSSQDGRRDTTSIEMELPKRVSGDDGILSTTSTSSTLASGPMRSNAQTTTTTRRHSTDNNARLSLELNDQKLSLASNNHSSKSLYDAIETGRSRRPRPFFSHFLVHFERSSMRLRRSYIFTYMQLLTYGFLGFQLTTFFGPEIGKLSGCPQLPLSFISYVLSSDDSDDSIALEMRRIQENVNFLLVVVMTTTFAALEITVITFPLEAKTVKREWRNGRYRVCSYFVGRTMADLPIQILCVLLFSLLTYSQTGQHGLYTWRFLSYCLILICCGLAAQTVGFIFGALFMDSLPLAVFTAPLSIFPSLLFSGFFARSNQLTPFYAFLSRISHFRYAFEALIITLYGHGRCPCDQDTLNQYHSSLESQTSTMRDMMKTMLGVSGCPQAAPTPASSNNHQNDIEDTTGFTGDIESFVAKDLATTTTISPMNLSSLLALSSSTTTTTERPMKAFEDALVDSVYAHMNSTSSSPADSQPSAVDMVTSKFTTKLTRMFNSRSNFGRPVPQNCTNFNSYLISEFELKDNDLIEGLIILFIVVLIFRIICNLLLTLTMRSKIN